MASAAFGPASVVRLIGTTARIGRGRAAVERGIQAVPDRTTQSMILPRALLRACRQALRRSKVADTSGQDMTGGALLMRSLILRRLLLREVLAPDEKNVGLLLPPSAGGVLANTAVTLAGRVTVNLNYTVSAEVMRSCIKQAGIRHVLTSRRVLEKLGYDLGAEPVFLEDVREKVTLADKLAGACAAYVMPLGLLERSLGLTRLTPDDLLTIIFTSGSTGEPKGVMLTYRNVGSNIEGFDQLVRLNDDDVVAGVLPFFHSFGYTATLWTVLTLPPKGVYHYDPRDARQVGEMCGKHRATILIATPTFLRFYLRRCQPEDFSALDVVLAGAEKVPKDLCDAFEQRFGVRPVEGYGATELSPVVAVNIPLSRAADKTLVNAREGTVGRPLPGVAAKIIDSDSGREVGRNTPGMLWISGPNVMSGYLGQPERTADVLRDGWYKTGDIALIDDDGFIRITGRESRFSKLGGEMVPHLKVEETIQKIIGAGEDELKVAVAAVPDERKGERLVVLHTAIDKAPDAICKELAQAGLPNLWIPSPDSFCQVEEIPVLGTGKIDLKGLQTLALEKFGKATASPA
ncbi:MAG TPA: AMP-binding protein [Pirellulales bacterium]